MHSTYVSDQQLKGAGAPVEGTLVEFDGDCFYKVSQVDGMAPFLMSLVSASDHWLFISSNGALTAGRRDPDHALFPYYTDDRIHDSQGQTGGRTLLRITRDGRCSLWEPFSQHYPGLYELTRNLYKSGHGNRILFEEHNHDLDLVFRCEWLNSERYGFVRRSCISNPGAGAVQVELLDGIQNVLPAGLERRFQLEYSTLADGYKRTELLPETGLALFRLSSIPADNAEPNEALRVNLAWSTGLEGATRLLTASAFEAFRQGLPLRPQTELKGRRGAYLLNATLSLGAGERRDWLIVAEVDQDATQVRALNRLLANPEDLRARLLGDIAQGTRNLVGLVASADGLQLTGDAARSWRHFANTLFNIMRGGVPDRQYQIHRADLQAFLAAANRELAEGHRALLAAQPETQSREAWIAALGKAGDPDLERLVHEYLPLTFSRRHGDPSRPWNIFSIQVKDAEGRKRLNYEGNWRDIFQNWEALGHSFPGFLDSMIFKFLDCSTVDGHNPYRVARNGFDWETVDPHDAWSFIGYWGDHQVIYLLKLLEAAQRFQPGSLDGLLERRIFTYADVPYRIKPYPELLANPRSTITFDRDAHERTMARAAQLGADGKLLQGGAGPIRASLAEKLLLVALAKLVNYIPEAGIWMNTQRPEWNDANNALVGYGVSVVTLCYLRRYLAFCQGLFAGSRAEAFELPVELADLLGAVTAVFEQHAATLGTPASPGQRKAILDALGQAGSSYRARVYQGGPSGRLATVPRARLQAFCTLVLGHLDHSINANRRADGLYHSYNLMLPAADGIAIRHLQLMLEGQVAALSGAALGADEDLAILDALRQSSLYRADQASYLLYPDRDLPTFLDRNNLPEASVAGSALLTAMLAAGDRRLVARDGDGLVHFHSDFRNVAVLQRALDELEGGPFQDLVAQDGGRVLAIYEEVFDHQSFTGRSGTFYKYEGLGCIYWHMVSKLVLAVDERRRATPRSATARLAALNGHYREISEGIGVHKGPAQYGAIPTDPYSHTPGFAGVQQPGMTGQVKEDILSRLSEMGVQVEAGRVAFSPELIALSEFLGQAGAFPYVAADGSERELTLEADCFAFTLCQVPVVAHRRGAPGIRVLHGDGSTRLLPGLELEAASSAALFERTGRIQRLDVFLGL
jgi:hypothetical protein